MSDKKTPPVTTKVFIGDSYTPQTKTPTVAEKGTYTAQTVAPKAPPPPPPKKI
ncbi:hypothetical protein NN6n1_36670 [Shinella zoogloeoides]